MNTALENRGRMLISCPDRPGIVSAVSQFVFEQGGNIVDLEQHSTDPVSGMFFLRVEFDLTGLGARAADLEARFAPVAQQFAMDWRLVLASKIKRLAIFVSKQDHCLLELLWQWKAGDLRANIALVIGNHPDLREAVTPYGIPFYHVPVQPQAKQEAEARHLELLREHQVDVSVFARYMQIVSRDFTAHFPNRIINIHHSFLPAFIGANPYEQAYRRGVKLIGATAHYVTEELDAGPIIEQDVQRVGHRDDAGDLKRIGRQIERVVLARAVTAHVDERVLVHGNKTVVFS